MRLALMLLFVLFISIALAVGLREDNGYALLAWGDTTVEMSMAMLILLTGVLFSLLWLTVRLVVGTWRLPARLRELRRRLRLRKARTWLTRGLIELAEGRWKDGERSLVRYAKYSETPLPHYLMAARAAQMLGEPERRDNWLRLAYETTPAATVAVLLTQAELQLGHRQLERALATLNRLRELAPAHAFALRLLARLHEERGEWQTLFDLLPELRRHDALERNELDALVARVTIRLMATAGTTEATALWNNLPRALRHEPDLALAYGQRLHAAGQDEEAESLLRGVLRKHWDDRLVDLYGLLRTADPGRQLGRAEAWLREHGDTPVLLLAAGRLCMRGGLWGKARSYLESSIALGPTAAAWAELAKLLQHTGEPERAAECRQQGLATALGEHPGVTDLPPSRAPVQPRSGNTRPRKSAGE